MGYDAVTASFAPRNNPFPGGDAIPTVYDPNWQSYTDLTSAQIIAFQSFPQDLVQYAATRRWLAEISGTSVGGIPLRTMDRDQQKVAALKQAFDAGAITQVSFFDAAGDIHQVNAMAATAVYTGIVLFVQALYNANADLQTSINATPPTVTTRKQIDAVYAPIAPNSPSATNPSPT